MAAPRAPPPASTCAPRPIRCATRTRPPFAAGAIFDSFIRERDGNLPLGSRYPITLPKRGGYASPFGVRAITEGSREQRLRGQRPRPVEILWVRLFYSGQI